MNQSRPNIFRLISHMLAAVLNSRSAFQQQWRHYEEHPAKAAGIEGRWVGEWISETSGHRGELRCVLAPVSNGLYRAYFYASFSKLFRVGYVTELKAELVNERTLLKGEQDLGGLAGGIYRCEGELSGSEFNCRYCCKYDRGVFRLKRLNR